MVLKINVLKTVVVAISLTMFLAGSACAFNNHHNHKFNHKVDFNNYKNVIVLIPDGCDETIQTVARWYIRSSQVGW